MIVSVFYEGKESKVSVKENDKLRDIALKCNINPETVLIKIDNEIHDQEETIIKEKGIKKIEFMKVISGG